jgi:hypothetical protein
MAHPSLILPQADASCGRLFYGDRHTADAHRIALEVWNRATGRVRDGYRLAVCRCRRCGGYHIGHRPIIAKPIDAEPSVDRGLELGPSRAEEPGMPW